MKKILSILVLGALMACLVPAHAQDAQEWKNTSVMQTSGSALTPQLTPVGATSVALPITSTEPYSPLKSPGRPRREQSSGDPWGQNQDGGDTTEEGSPLGDGLIPLSLLALAYAGVVYFRKRKQTLNG